jgi:hypothetical protein
VPVKLLAVLLAALALCLEVAAPAPAQTGPPVATPPPWRPRPVIIVDPRAYLATPIPTRRPLAKYRAHTKPHAAATRRPVATPSVETFEHHETAPTPRP